MMLYMKKAPQGSQLAGPLPPYLLYTVNTASFSCLISKEKKQQEAQPDIYGNLYL